MPRTPFKVLFVCLGNICRSPAAENILRHLLQDSGDDELIEIDSAGTHDFHPGKSPDRRMTQVLKRRGIGNPGNGRQFTKKDFLHFDLIVVMDTENLENVSRLDPTKRYQSKIRCMTDFCSLPKFQIPEVPDPYYGGEEGFEFVADLLTDGCHGIHEHIQSATQ